MEQKDAGKQLSIIIPMYNAEKTIEKCLHSLLVPKEQMQRLEVVVVDDGSSDRSAAYADRYRRKYPGSFCLVQKENGGHGFAVNAGAARCSGRYLKVLDADDWMHTDSLAEMLQLLETVDAQAVACGYDQCRMQGRGLRKAWMVHIPSGLAAEEKTRYLDMEQLLREWGRFRQIFCLHGLMYQTEFYRQLSYRMPEGVSYDDAFFFTVPCSHAAKLCVMRTQLYVYRIGDPAQSISAQNREKRMDQMEKVIWSVMEADSDRFCPPAGREYRYRKLVSVVSDYYVTAFLRCSDKRRGRKAARMLTGRICLADRELYRRLRSRYWLLLSMGLCHRTEQDFNRLVYWISFVKKAGKLPDEFQKKAGKLPDEFERMLRRIRLAKKEGKQPDVFEKMLRRIRLVKKEGKQSNERLLPVKTLVKSVLQQIFVIPAAAVYYRVRIRRKGVYHLIICGHIGDFLYTMGYADAFQETYGLEKLCIVSAEKFRGLAACYPRKGRSYCAVSEKWLHLLCIANRYAAGQLLFAGWKDCLAAEPANGFVQGFSYAKDYPQLCLKNCICQGVLKLPPDSAFRLPVYRKKCIQEAAGSTGRGVQAHAVKPGSSGKILLCPFAQAVCDKDAGPFFRKLAKRLAAKQYQVEVNAPDGQLLLPGVRVVSYRLEEMLAKMGSYEAVIGIRSGLLDLAVFAGCRVGALYPAAYGLIRFYDLRQAAACVQECRQESGRVRDRLHKEKEDTGRELFQYELTGDMEQDLSAVTDWLG